VGEGEDGGGARAGRDGAQPAGQGSEGLGGRRRRVGGRWSGTVGRRNGREREVVNFGRSPNSLLFFTRVKLMGSDYLIFGLLHKKVELSIPSVKSHL